MGAVWSVMRYATGFNPDDELGAATRAPEQFAMSLAFLASAVRESAPDIIAECDGSAVAAAAIAEAELDARDTLAEFDAEVELLVAEFGGELGDQVNGAVEVARRDAIARLTAPIEFARARNRAAALECGRKRFRHPLCLTRSGAMPGSDLNLMFDATIAGRRIAMDSEPAALFRTAGWEAVDLDPQAIDTARQLFAMSIAGATALLTEARATDVASGAVAAYAAARAAAIVRADCRVAAWWIAPGRNAQTDGWLTPTSGESRTDVDLDARFAAEYKVGLAEFQRAVEAAPCFVSLIILIEWGNQHDEQQISWIDPKSMPAAWFAIEPPRGDDAHARVGIRAVAQREGLFSIAMNTAARTLRSSSRIPVALAGIGDLVNVCAGDTVYTVGLSTWRKLRARLPTALHAMVDALVAEAPARASGPVSAELTAESSSVSSAWKIASEAACAKVAQDVHLVFATAVAAGEIKLVE